MAIRDFRQLRCWQLAHKLRCEVNEICEIPTVAKDRSFCDSFRGTSSSVCRNLAEGFTRFKSPDIVLFFRYAISSLGELQDHLEECLTRKFIGRKEYDRLTDLASHAKATARRFMRSHEERAKKAAGESKGPTACT